MTFPWTHPVTLSLLSSGALVVLLFCLYEWKCAKLPIVPSEYVHCWSARSNPRRTYSVYIQAQHSFRRVYLYVRQVGSSRYLYMLDVHLDVLCFFLCSGFVFFSSLYYIPQFFQAGLGYSPIRAGMSSISQMPQVLRTFIRTLPYSASRRSDRVLLGCCKHQISIWYITRANCRHRAC